ncbi:MAG: penicillin-binding protein 1C [Brumimicrobium sp.]
MQLNIKIGTYTLNFKRRKLFYFGVFVFFVYFWFCLPQQLFKAPTSTILLDRSGYLLNAQIAEDGQWRFPEIDSTPYKFKEALISYEDKSFDAHWGVSIPSIFRAFYQNISAGKIVSGGSTITMQVARMSRKSSRTIFNKIIEVFWAYRMEIRHSKEEIMNLYASNAPFGGNVVGIEAASWRYFGMSPHQLSWAQSATLAVLPNAPGLIHFGKNREKLVEKRNKVLSILLERKKIDSLTYSLAIEEPLANSPKPLPMVAPHLMNRMIKKGNKGKRITSTLNYQKQEQLNNLLEHYQNQLNQNYIHNAAVLVIDLKSNEVVSYIGNSATKQGHAKDVDIIQAPRSTGSVLKPFLYSAMIQEGQIHNDMLIPDVPLRFDNFAPKNYEDKHDGAVKASSALSRSLNVPAVYLLKEYGIEKFLHLLKHSEQRHINKSAAHYGLSLILGGAESSLWDVAKVYAGMAKTLNHYAKFNSYTISSWEAPKYILGENSTTTLYNKTKSTTHFDAGATYLTFEALLDVNRPNMESSWRQFSSSNRIAWKTGTSFGNRDAWAVGCTPEFAVAVWVGNASGEGRPGIVGTLAAAPIMFDVFSRLDLQQKWFGRPYDELRSISICAESGHRNTANCTKIDTVQAHKNMVRTTPCNFHETILTDETEQYQYNVDCEPASSTKFVTRFVLPPLQAWYYKSSHPEYRTLPPFHPSCESSRTTNRISIVYPENGSELVATKDLNSNENGFVFEVVHQASDSQLFWHIDDKFIGTTAVIHKVNFLPTPGKHQLTVLDEKGNQAKVNFEVLE